MAKKKPDKLDEFLDSLTENATAEEILKDGSILKEQVNERIEFYVSGKTPRKNTEAMDEAVKLAAKIKKNFEELI
jgi:hypothetical protein